MEGAFFCHFETWAKDPDPIGHLIGQGHWLGLDRVDVQKDPSLVHVLVPHCNM